MSNSTSATSDDLSIQHINFGNGLVLFAALTALIGSDIAETLALGERGPAGLVWSIASAFGAPSVIKAFISGASPGWLRSLLGLRSIASDRAIGLDLKLTRKSSQAIKARRTFDHDPLGVTCDAKALREVHREPLSRDHPSCKDVYAFNRSIMCIVGGLRKTLPRDPLTVYNCITTGLMAHVTWRSFRPSLSRSSSVSGCIITFREMFLARRLADIGNLDTVIGELPTLKKAGGEKKVVLGLPAEPRTSIWWRLMWSIGGLLHVVSLALTYFILSKMAPAFTLVWAGFQVAWLACRILTYYFTESMPEPMADRMMVGHRWQDLDVLMRTRVLNLTLAVAQYQTHVHTRGIDKSSSIEIEIIAMIGDTVLSSAMWMVGSDVSPMDMYDSCLIFFHFPPHPPSLAPPLAPSTFAIPAARVGHSMGEFMKPDAEKSTPVFVPRGTVVARSACIQTWWCIWIPCGPNRWLQIQSKNRTVLGRYTAEVLDDWTTICTTRSWDLEYQLVTYGGG
ncbi:hypothetical protein F5887DRAFT_917627 [Amanita rubescens]|nr:hypothetical protein F5887DRAFT_917627 [Amanita rubescens]